MYAIVETGGKQYRVSPGDTVAVERLAGEPGDTLELGQVLLVAGNGEHGARVGSPGVPGAIVRAELIEHLRGEKIIVFRYKSKVRYRRKTGHRQALTRLRITDILLDGASAARTAEPAPAVEAETAAARRRRPSAATEPNETSTAAAIETSAAAPAVGETATAMPASAGEAGPEPTVTETTEEA